jgi:hypothetical protein
MMLRGDDPNWVGYGYGYGYGDGYGDGTGSGSGSGTGSGSGSGSGSGTGDGYGDGYGYGYGYGDGDGYGYGDSSGSGYGSGYVGGDGDGYWTAVLRLRRDVQDALSRGAAEVAYWRSDARGRPCHGGSGTVARVGLVEEIAGPLQICTARALHATHDPMKWSGDRLWIVALWGEVQYAEDKLGALKREFLAEMTPP